MKERILPGTMWEGTHTNATIVPKSIKVPGKILSQLIVVLLVVSWEMETTQVSSPWRILRHVLLIHTGLLFSHLNGWYPILGNGVDGAGDHCRKLNEPGREWKRTRWCHGGSLTRMSPIGSYIWVLCPELAFPCWRRCVTGAGLEVSKDLYYSQCPLCLLPVDQDVGSQLLLQCHAPCHDSQWL